ncbi:MAG TPA: glycosyltransferase [Opitutus sp.]|nr:glycosyltransferase [Opitutus sp.]
MRFSIIIPSFNQGRFIGRTLRSILQQDYGPAQIIVADGGSTDNTLAVLRSFGERVTWWSEPDGGFADAVNKALPLVDGDIVGIQSSDDFYLPGAFAAVARQFADHPKLGVVSGSDLTIDLDYRIVAVGPACGPITTENLFPVGLPQHATFARSTVLRALRGLRSDVDLCADADLWFRAAHHYEGRRFADFIAVYQAHPAQRTSTLPNFSAALARVIEDAEQDRTLGGRFRFRPEDKAAIIRFFNIHWKSPQGRDLAEKSRLARAEIPSVRRSRNIPLRLELARYARFTLASRTSQLLFVMKNGLLLPLLRHKARLHRARRRAAKLDLRWTERTPMPAGSGR